jgi:predicted nucleotidyltransferase
VRDIISRYPVEHPRIFGSVLHGDDSEESDLDILVDPTEETSILSLVRLEVELRHLLGVEVDVITPEELKADYGAGVLAEAMPL